MTGRHAAAAAPKTLLHSQRVTAASKTITPGPMSCESRRCAASLVSVPRMAAAPLRRPVGTPRRPWLAGSRRLPELGGLARPRPHVESLRPTQKPRREGADTGPAERPAGAAPAGGGASRLSTAGSSVGVSSKIRELSLAGGRPRSGDGPLLYPGPPLPGASHPLAADGLMEKRSSIFVAGRSGPGI